MKVYTSKRWLYIAVSILLFFFSCRSVSHRSSAGTAQTVASESKLVSLFEKGDLRYEVYQHQVADFKTTAKHSEKNIRLSLRIINQHSSVSPLRAISTDLNTYNSYYEYFLNDAKNDFLLRVDGAWSYPKLYAYENNYNTFPFETVDLGYRIASGSEKGITQLVYIDKVFAQDSIFFDLNNLSF